MIGLAVRQLVQVDGRVLGLVAGLVVGLGLLVIAVGAVVHLLLEGRLVLLHHVGGGAAAGHETQTTAHSSALLGTLGITGTGAALRAWLYLMVA